MIIFPFSPGSLQPSRPLSGNCLPRSRAQATMRTKASRARRVFSFYHALWDVDALVSLSFLFLFLHPPTRWFLYPARVKLLTKVCNGVRDQQPRYSRSLALLLALSLALFRPLAIPEGVFEGMQRRHTIYTYSVLSLALSFLYITTTISVFLSRENFTPTFPSRLLLLRFFLSF